MAAKKPKSLEIKDVTMAFGKDVHWVADGPALDRDHNHKGASVELQGDYDRDGHNIAKVFVAKNGLAQATFRSGRDLVFSPELDNETSEKAWKLADQLVAILDIRKAAELVAGKKSAQIDLTALRSAVTDLDPAYIPKDQLISLHDNLAALGPRAGAAKETVLKAIRIQAEAASRELVQGARHIKQEFGKVSMSDGRAVDDMLDGLRHTIGQIGGSLSFLRRDFLQHASADRTAKALGQVSTAMNSLPDDFKETFDSFGQRVTTQARTFGVS